MSEKPRECPFCGGEAFLERWMPDNDGRIYCQSCVASLPVTSQQSDAAALTAWNRRAGGDGARKAERQRDAAMQKMAQLWEALERISNHPAADTEYIDYGPDRKQRIWPTVRDEACAALASVPAQDGWRDMTDKPSHAMPVIYWFGNRWWHKADGTRADPDPVRDPAERAEIGFWNGEEWCEAGTGHDVFEPWREERNLPTHYRPLPAPPEGKR